MDEKLISRSAVKAYALELSAKLRVNRFTRVSESFVLSVEAAVDAVIRQTVPVQRDCYGEKPFLTPFARKKMIEQLERRVASIIEGKVKGHPSIGVTLMS